MSEPPKLDDQKKKEVLAEPQLNVNEPMRVDPNSYLEKYQEKIMFSSGWWLFIPWEERQSYQAIFKEFLENPHQQTSTRAKELADLWWKAHVPFLPQVLYLLSMLYQKSNQFLIDQLEEELLDVLPDEWKSNEKRPAIDLNVLGTSKMDIIGMNMVVRCTVGQPDIYTVNPLIQKMSFFPIRDRMISYVYHTTTNKQLFVGRIDTILYKDMKGYIMSEEQKQKVGKYDFRSEVVNGVETREDSILTLALINKELFDVEQINRKYYVKAKLIEDRTAVPMYFTSGDVQV